MTTFGSRLSTCYRVLQKERLLTYGVNSPGQSRGISPLHGVGGNKFRVRGATNVPKWKAQDLLSRLRLGERGELKGGWERAFFFWTMLRASLQLWQSLSCANIVIVRQRDQKERSGIKKNKQTKPKQTPKQHQKPSNRPVPDQSAKVKQGETSSGSHRKLQSPALTTSSAGNSQRPMQCVVTQ